MAEGFVPIETTTGLELSDVQTGQGKRLWLFRVPRHITTQSLQGARIKLPRKTTEGKVLGRLSSEESNPSEGGTDQVSTGSLVFTCADGAESSSFRALLSGGEEGSLAVAGPFAGQVNVSVVPPPLPVAQDIPEDGSLAGLVEPYRGRPQLTGMRVRSKLVGAGTEYTRRNRQPAASTPRSKHAAGAPAKKRRADAGSGERRGDRDNSESPAESPSRKSRRLD
ncbi:unnamed protein product, partial [Sphacelaria rigidula]